MKPAYQVWSFIAHQLSQEKKCMLLFVLESQGSSPGRQGFCMAVNEEGLMEGSIGGGIMEHKFVEMAKSSLLHGDLIDKDGQVKQQVHNAESKENRSGMICSGEQTLWLYPVKDEDAGAVKEILQGYNRNTGIIKLHPGGIEFIPGTMEKNKQYKAGEQWEYRESLSFQNQLTIIGGGHCSLALSKLFSAMDFYIRVYDSRDHLSTMDKNNWAHEKHVITTYENLGELVESGNDHYVVIMSFGYRTDDEAVRALRNKSFKYLGLLGSKKKIETMKADYAVESGGNFLDRIHAPIGVAINSQTPEEIAISIAAEIIAVKNNA